MRSLRLIGEYLIKVQGRHTSRTHQLAYYRTSSLDLEVLDYPSNSRTVL